MSQLAIRKRLYSTTAISTEVGKLGDQAVDITKPTLVIFDGVTAGGVPLAKEVHTHADATNSTSGFESAADHVYLYTHTHPNATTLVAGFMSAADKAKLDGLSSGGGGLASSASVPGTLVLRDGSADFAAHNITGNSFIGPLTGNADTVTNGVVTTGSYSNPAWITSLDASKITGLLASGVVTWAAVSGKPSVVSYFINDAGYINSSANITGTSGGVLSTGGRETASPTASTVILRDGSGRAQVAAPSAPSDIATKAYVDANGGNVSYYPVIVSDTTKTLSGSPLTWNTTVLNLTEVGFLRSIFVNASGGTPANVFSWTNISVGITIDGQAELLISYPTFLLHYGVLDQPLNGFLTQVWSNVTLVDMPYKQSLVVRFTGTSISSTSGSFSLTFGANRYVRAL